jgi:biotin carboxyl carrier protein
VTVEVEIDGHRHCVELERQGNRWVATIGNQSLAVDIAPLPRGWSLLVSALDPGQDDRDRRTSYDVVIDDPGATAGESAVYVNGEAIGVRVIDPRAWHRGQRASGGGSRVVTSAMPGRVVKVLVRPGDRVATRQGLVVIEAMKMENELRAPRDAVVAEVNVIEGASVEAGAILVVLE